MGEDGSIAVSVAIVGVCSVAIVEQEEQDPKWRCSPAVNVGE